MNKPLQLPLKGGLHEEEYIFVCALNKLPLIGAGYIKRNTLCSQLTSSRRDGFLEEGLVGLFVNLLVSCIPSFDYLLSCNDETVLVFGCAYINTWSLLLPQTTTVPAEGIDDGVHGYSRHSSRRQR